jgi:pimeloyl-ACP methyl ester carboxylesterase
MRTVRSGAVRVAFEETGAGVPVLFLHGAGLTHRLWDPQVERLRDRYRCIAVDLRGHGETTCDADVDTYLVEDHAEDVRDLLDGLGIDRAHVVGLSLGGMVALAFGLAHPERVISLATMGTPVHATPSVFARTTLAVGTRYLFRRLRRSDGADWLARSSAKRWSKLPEVRAYMIEDCRGIDVEEFKRVWRGVVRYALRDRLPEMKLPVLVIAGARDANRRQSRRSSELLPNARFELVDGAGHITNRDATETVNGLLVQWLAEHGGPA